MSPKMVTRFFVMIASVLAICEHASSQEKPKKTESSANRIALNGACCVSLVEMSAHVKAEKRFSSRWRGLRYLFLS